MDMPMQTRTSPHPLMWAAAIAVILFSAAGIAAIMGWIPNSMGNPSDQEASGQSTTKVAQAPAQVPTRARPAPGPTRSAVCAECGVVESVREVVTRGEGSGIGVAGGAVVGGLLGNQVGSGRGQDAMTVVGAVGGALAGNEIEKRVKSTRSYAITVRFEDGSSRAFSEANAPSWRTGDKVKVVNGVIRSNA